MTTGLDYDEYVTALAQLAVVEPDDENFLALLPSVITYAENRMCRDLDFLSTVASDIYAISINSRTITVPENDFVTVQAVNILTPSGTSDPNNATRNPLVPRTKFYLDMMYPSYLSKALPKFYAPFNSTTYIVGPWSDADYSVEFVGTTRPVSLSEDNTTTFISTYLPDLMLMASMVFVSAQQRNFSAMSNDPQMPVNYESQYEKLKLSAMVEEARKKAEASAWTAMSPAAAASPNRQMGQ